jgi:hypothetical protein
MWISPLQMQTASGAPETEEVRAERNDNRGSD